MSSFLSQTRKRLGPWWNATLYSIMLFIVAGLLFLLHVLSNVQASNNDPMRRWEMAQKLIQFSIPEHYELTSAIYIVHPHFFVLTNKNNGQKIRVMENRWWVKHRTPDGFQTRFAHPGRWIKDPGMGYEKILVEKASTVSDTSQNVPYVLGTLSSAKEGEAEQGLLACLYSEKIDKSLCIFSSGPAKVFSSTEVTNFIEDLSEQMP